MFFCILKNETELKKIQSNNVNDILIYNLPIIELFESSTLTIDDFLKYRTDNIEGNLGV